MTIQLTAQVLLLIIFTTTFGWSMNRYEFLCFDCTDESISDRKIRMRNNIIISLISFTAIAYVIVQMKAAY